MTLLDLFRKPVEVAPVFERVPWSRADAEVLHEFLTSHVGRRFRRLMKVDEATAAWEACRVSAGRREHAAGIAVGMGRNYNAILSRCARPVEGDGPSAPLLEEDGGRSGEEYDMLSEMINKEAGRAVVGD